VRSRTFTYLYCVGALDLPNASRRNPVFNPAQRVHGTLYGKSKAIIVTRQSIRREGSCHPVGTRSIRTSRRCGGSWRPPMDDYGLRTSSTCVISLNHLPGCGAQAHGTVSYSRIVRHGRPNHDLRREQNTSAAHAFVVQSFHELLHERAVAGQQITEPQLSFGPAVGYYAISKEQQGRAYGCVTKRPAGHSPRTGPPPSNMLHPR
jgi:hypothetical protein